MESWRPVVGYEGLYEVSDLGRVRSVDRYVPVRNGGQRFYRSKILREQDNGIGYRYVALSDARGRRNHYVHRLVLEAFRGSCPPGKEACHFPNDDKSHNVLTNLLWGTREDNIQQAKDAGAFLGSKNLGSKNGNAKLNEQEVIEVRIASSDGISDSDLADAYGVASRTIRNICRRVTWKHLPTSETRPMI
jgi:hypothetical protein